MLSYLKRYLYDIRTIKFLFQNAERIANAEGHSKPGTEHFVLAAMELPDGTARKTFQRIHADSASFRTAIAKQHAEALRDVGIEISRDNPLLSQSISIPPKNGLYQAQASVQSLMKAIWKLRSNRPLLGAHVILAALSAQHGITPRALHSMGIDPATLANAAKLEIELMRA